MSKVNNKVQEMANKDVKKYVAMAIVGYSLFTFGFVLIIVGAVLMGTVGDKKVDPALFTPLLVIGIILVVGPGLALGTVGTACWISLGTQIKVARNKLKKQDFEN